MTPEQKKELRAKLEAIIGEISPDDPNYDDKRAYILTGGRDLNELWESAKGDPELEAQAKIKAEERLARLLEYIARNDWEE